MCAQETSPPSSEGQVTIQGTVERVTFHSEETGFTVARLAIEGSRTPVTITGTFPGIAAGESVLLYGQWTTHPQYGPQFRAERYQVVRPATALGIQRYLGSGLIKGVGPVTAKRLVAHFGAETIDVIERDPERLLEVPGVGPARAAMIKKAWEEQREIKNIMLFLQGHGVSTAYAVKIYKTYGDRAIQAVEENPYRLTDIWGIGFKTADRIAMAMGTSRDSPQRLRAGLLYVLNKAAEDGHVYLPEPKLVEVAAKELDADLPRLQPELRELAKTGEVVLEPLQADQVPSAQPKRAPSQPSRAAPPSPAGQAGQPGPLFGEQRQTPTPSQADTGHTAVYIPSLYQTERGIVTRLRDLMRAPIRRDLASEGPTAWIATHAEPHGVHLSSQQVEAVSQALTQKVLIITGGPGTGKTTATRAIVTALRRLGRRVELASPTGRAAKRLGDASGHEARTIHRMLEFDPSSMGFKRGPDNPLECDALILDEVSMMDEVLFYSVLKALPLTAQLILVGDADQLPSVGPGNVIRDLIASGVVPVVRLTQIFRQAAASLIVTNAHKINRGEYPNLPTPQQAPNADCVFLQAEQTDHLAAVVTAVVTTSLPKRGFGPMDIQVISPMNRGAAGAANLNLLLQQALNPPRPGRPEVTRAGRTYRAGDRVIQIVNNYEKQVFNGDIGTVQRIDEEEQVLYVAFPDGTVPYDFADLDELQLAYALSVHKSQGSEYPAVVLPIHTQHYVMLQRNLLYTALTRAKRMAVLVGSRRAVRIAVGNSQEVARYTRLRERLAGAL